MKYLGTTMLVLIALQGQYTTYKARQQRDEWREIAKLGVDTLQRCRATNKTLLELE